jgi:hypothetical protein
MEFIELPAENISMESKRKIFWESAVDFYRFPDGYLPTEFTEATDKPLVPKD